MKNFTLMSCRLLLVAALVATAGALAPAAAQTGTPSGPPTTGPAPDPNTPDPTAVPIDGGAGLLLAGGVAYGLRQLRQRRKK